MGGDRTVELLNRWTSDCLDIRPDWLSIRIGVNDVGCKFWPWEDHLWVPEGAYVPTSSSS